MKDNFITAFEKNIIDNYPGPNVLLKDDARFRIRIYILADMLRRRGNESN